MLGKLYYVRFADENEGGSVVDTFGKVLGKLYYARFADENEGGTGVVLVLGIRYIFAVSDGSREAELETLNACL